MRHVYCGHAGSDPSSSNEYRQTLSGIGPAVYRTLILRSIGICGGEVSYLAFETGTHLEKGMVLANRNIQMGDLLRDDYSQAIRQENNDDADDVPMSYFMDDAAERKFSQILWDLFDKDFENEDTDRRIPEEADSLMDDDRTFLLNCLTGSPSFGYFHRRLAELRRLLGRDKTDFPDRRVFVWLTHILYWISGLQGASRPSSVIRKRDAQQLIAAGERVFLNIPDSVQKLLSKHLVHVSSKNKQNNIGVWSREGGAHSSPGILCLRWCALILEALKSDYEQMLSWEQTKNEVRDTVQSIINLSTDRRSPDVIHRLSVCEQELWRLHHEEQDMVVRVGKTPSELHQQVQDYLKKLSTAEMRHNYATKEYGTVDAVASYRDELLDSLLVRVEAHGSLGLDSAISEHNNKRTAPTDNPKRNKIRSRFFQAFWKRSETLPNELKDDLFFMCQWKAWEVEDALDDSLEDKSDEPKQKQYNTLARALVHSLEDHRSVLFLRVLGSIVSADDLVRMSPDELANPIVQQERQAALASASAQRNLVGATGLNGGTAKVSGETKRETLDLATKQGSSGDAMKEKVIASGAALKPQPSKTPVASTVSQQGNSPKDEDIFFKKVISKQEPLLKGSTSSWSNPGTSQKTPLKMSALPLSSQGKSSVSKIASTKRKSPAHGESKEKPPTKVQKKLSMKDYLARLAPKPPAAPSPRGPENDGFSDVPHEKLDPKMANLIQNTDGNKLFRFTFKKNQNVDFEAFLDRAMDQDFIANNYFPQTMHSTGTCRVDSAEEFLGSKLVNSSRYSHYVLRVKPQVSQLEQYKKFYHLYEAERKIPMFKMGETAKAFLITPKHHSRIKAVSFPRSDASYLVGYKAKTIMKVNL